MLDMQCKIYFHHDDTSKGKNEVPRGSVIENTGSERRARLLELLATRSVLSASQIELRGSYVSMVRCPTIGNTYLYSQSKSKCSFI
jgi:hypothetical protein